MRITKAPPPEIAVIIGEVLYQVRSALDHAFFDLVKRNHAGVTPPPKNWERRSQFPLRNKASGKVKGDPSFPPRCHFDKTLDALTDRAFNYIESVQPYQTDELVTAEGHTSTSLSLPLADGAELRPAWHPPDMVTPDAKRTRCLAPTIVFNEPGVGSETPIEKVLYELPRMMYGWMLPHLHNL